MRGRDVGYAATLMGQNHVDSGLLIITHQEARARGAAASTWPRSALPTDADRSRLSPSCSLSGDGRRPSRWPGGDCSSGCTSSEVWTKFY